MLPAYLNAKIQTTDEDEIFSMFSHAAQSIMEALDFRAASAANRGKRVRFRPGQGLHPSSVAFVRAVIQPSVSHCVSGSEDRAISIFSYFNLIVIQTLLQLFQYIGTWNILLYYVWPSYWSSGARDIVYFSVGLLIAFISQRFYSMDKSYEFMEDDWKHGIPVSFNWKRKLDSYARDTLSFFGYIFLWVGAWDFIDTKMFPASGVRDGIYVLIPIFAIFVFDEVLLPESIYYMCARCVMSREDDNCNYDTDSRKYSVLGTEDSHNSINNRHLHHYEHEDNYNKNNSNNSIGYDINNFNFEEDSNYFYSYFKTGQKFSPSTDWFIREVIQPTMSKYISPASDLAIRVFNYINTIFIISIVNVFQWIGIWNLLATYWVWPDSRIRDAVYAIVGFLIMLISMRFFNIDYSYDDMEDSWHDGIPNSFGWDRKFIRYCRETFSFFGFLFCWAGSWDVIDTQIVQDSLWRNLVYILVPLFLGFIFAYILSVESLYYFAAKRGEEALLEEYGEYDGSQPDTHHPSQQGTQQENMDLGSTNTIPIPRSSPIPSPSQSPSQIARSLRTLQSIHASPTMRKMSPAVKSYQGIGGVVARKRQEREQLRHQQHQQQD